MKKFFTSLHNRRQQNTHLSWVKPSVSKCALTCAEDGWPLGGGITFASSLLFSTSKQPLLLLLFGLWPVLVGQLEELGGC